MASSTVFAIICGFEGYKKNPWKEDKFAKVWSHGPEAYWQNSGGWRIEIVVAVVTALKQWTTNICSVDCRQGLLAGV